MGLQENVGDNTRHTFNDFQGRQLLHDLKSTFHTSYYDNDLEKHKKEKKIYWLWDQFLSEKMKGSVHLAVTNKMK